MAAEHDSFLKKNEKYDPFTNRQVKKPLTDSEAFINLLKVSTGCGVLTLPYAFKNAGLVVGLVGTVLIGIISAHCIQILVQTSHRLCYQLKVPMLDYPSTVLHSFERGPPIFRRIANPMSWLIKGLFLMALGPCAIFVVMMSSTIKQLAEPSLIESDIHVRYYILMIWVPLMLLCFVPDLKYIVLFSGVASASLGVVIVITFYYFFEVVEDPNERNFVANPIGFPTFLVMTAFSMECAAIVLTVENEMKNPKHFVSKSPYVFFSTLAVIVIFDSFIGFLGYLRFGESTKENILANLLEAYPEDPLAKSAQYLFMFSLLVTHTLILFIPTTVIWGQIKGRIPEKRHYCSLVALRLLLATFTVALAAAVPNLGPIISLTGAFSFPLVGLLIPAAVELAERWETSLGRWNWVLWKDGFLILFAVTVSICGVFSTVQGIILLDVNT